MSIENEDKFCDEASIHKIRKQINQVDKVETRLIFLVLSGSFNPVHTQHISALILTKKYLESLKWKVIGGFLAPSSDDYVDRKLKSQALNLNFRIDLCRLAIGESDWMHVCVKGEFSSKWASLGIRRELEHYCHDVLNGRRLMAVEIMGSDSFLRIFDKIIMENSSAKENQHEQNRMICCLTRPGSQSTSDREHIRYIIEPVIGDLGVDLMMPRPEELDFLLKDVSSADIRDLIAKNEWDIITANAWLDPEVLNALRSRV